MKSRLLCMIMVLIICTPMLYSQVSVLELNGYTWKQLNTDEKAGLIVGWYMCSMVTSLIFNGVGQNISSYGDLPPKFKDFLSVFFQRMSKDFLFLKRGSEKEYSVAEIIKLVDLYYINHSLEDTINMAIITSTQKTKEFIALFQTIEENFFNSFRKR